MPTFNNESSVNKWTSEVWFAGDMPNFSAKPAPKPSDASKRNVYAEYRKVSLRLRNNDNHNAPALRGNAVRNLVEALLSCVVYGFPCTIATEGEGDEVRPMMHTVEPAPGSTKPATVHNVVQVSDKPVAILPNRIVNALCKAKPAGRKGVRVKVGRYYLIQTGGQTTVDGGIPICATNKGVSGIGGILALIGLTFTSELVGSARAGLMIPGTKDLIGNTDRDAVLRGTLHRWAGKDRHAMKLAFATTDLASALVEASIGRSILPEVRVEYAEGRASMRYRNSEKPEALTDTVYGSPLAFCNQTGAYIKAALVNGTGFEETGDGNGLAEEQPAKKPKAPPAEVAA